MKGDMSGMNELNLTPDQRVEYDALMEEMKRELETLPDNDGSHLSCAAGNIPYQRIAQKYKKRILDILENR